jgi:hypothetical protein
LSHQQICGLPLNLLALGVECAEKKTFAYSMDKQQDSITTLPAKQPEEQRSAEPEFQLGPPKESRKKHNKDNQMVLVCQKLPNATVYV